jgi:peptide chain release factor 3
MTLTSPNQAARRRTFAIISHPDAGKTTLTENILLSAGAIRAAGAVRARGENRRTRSDWMKIERERGISVSASVMSFEYDGLLFNLLDTPGHEDFSEDTYRTLTAADSAVMVLDAAKGIEPQTLKLFEVCRLRDIPILTFINKMDREAQDPLELLDEIQDKLALDASPLQWPAASGNRFAGVMDLRRARFIPYQRNATTPEEGEMDSWNEDEWHARLPAEIADALDEEAGLAREGYPEFSLPSYREGHMTPVLFGSALRHFGVRELIQTLGEIAPGPEVKDAGLRQVGPDDPEVSGFVFKVQANMDPQHRDRIAFVKLCSGEFRRGMKLRSSEKAKPITISSPIMFFAQDREIADEAYAGDVIGVPNHGILRVGDSLSETGKLRYTGIPNFAPEILRRARTSDPLKAKHLRKALQSLAEEGVTQLFTPELGADMVVGAVGALQFDVMAERMVAEYGLEVIFEVPPVTTARWLTGSEDEIEAFAGRYRNQMARDLDEARVFLARDGFEANYVVDKFPRITFARTRERQ